MVNSRHTERTYSCENFQFTDEMSLSDGLACMVSRICEIHLTIDIDDVGRRCWSRYIDTYYAEFGKKPLPKTAPVVPGAMQSGFSVRMLYNRGVATLTSLRFRFPYD
jgi:hypothetical protein